jgi:hypothetical protein
MTKSLLCFGLLYIILSTFIGIIFTAAHGQNSTLQPPPYSNPVPPQQPTQNPYSPNQQGQQQQPQYPPQLQQQFQPPQQQLPAGFGVLMNESKVMNCLHSVLHSSVDKAFKHAAGLNEATFMNNATSTLDSCILPRG